MLGLLRAEIRKLTSTKLVLAFLAVIVVLVAINMFAVIWGTDYDGSKGFISTAADQQSLVAFAANAMILSGLFGAIATAREYGHLTVIPMFLLTPRRGVAYGAQVLVIGLAGALLGLVGSALLIAGVAVALGFTDYSFLIPFNDVVQVLVAATATGLAGGILGAGLGVFIRNLGGAVSGVVVALLILPPTLGQLAKSLTDWVPAALSAVVSGTGGDLSVPGAVLGLALWGLIPVALGLVSVLRRDVA